MSRVRNWCFTVNNPDIDDILPDHADIRYVVWQRERGAEGTEHWQGYVEFDKPMRLAAVKLWLPTAHFEPRRGTRDQARDYCMKADSRINGPWERGDWSVVHATQHLYRDRFRWMWVSSGGQCFDFAGPGGVKALATTWQTLSPRSRMAVSRGLLRNTLSPMSNSTEVFTPSRRPCKNPPPTPPSSPAPGSLASSVGSSKSPMTAPLCGSLMPSVDWANPDWLAFCAQRRVLLRSKGASPTWPSCIMESAL